MNAVEFKSIADEFIRVNEFGGDGGIRTADSVMVIQDLFADSSYRI